MPGRSPPGSKRAVPVTTNPADLGPAAARGGGRARPGLINFLSIAPHAQIEALESPAALPRAAGTPLRRGPTTPAV